MVKRITGTQAKGIIGGGHGDYKAGEIAGRVFANFVGDRLGSRVIRYLRRW